MKRMISFLLAAALLFSLTPNAWALDKTGYAIVTADNPTDRLNLRKSASAESDSLGRYYIGTRVYILGEKGDYTKVEIGAGDGKATGYMLTKYLIPETENANYATYIFCAKTSSSGELLNSPGAGGKVLDTYKKYDVCLILGDIGDDWRHVQLNGFYGYVRASRLYEKYAYIWQTYLKTTDASGVVPLYSQQSLSSGVNGYFFADTAVEVHSIEKNGWSYVTICGTGDYMPGDMGGEQFSGYVQNKFLNINDPDLSERVVHRASELPVFEITRPVMHEEIGRGADDSDVFFMTGTAVAALGYTKDNRAIIQYGRGMYVIPNDASTGTNRYVTARSVPAIGYGFAIGDESENKSYAYPSENEAVVDYFSPGQAFSVVSKLEQFYQLNENASFFPIRNARYYDLAALYSAIASVGVGTYAVGSELTSAMYTLKMGRAVVTIGDRSKTYETIGDCTFYLPAGATLTVESGTVVPAKQGYVLTSDNEFAADLSGRYFAGTQMVTRRQWDYKIRAAAGTEGAYYVISSLLNDDLSQETTREEMRVLLEPGETYIVTLYDSEMVEFFHCDVEVFYGNG